MSAGHIRDDHLQVLRAFHSGVVADWRSRERELRRLGANVTLVTARSWNEGGAEVSIDAHDESWVVPCRTFGRHPFVFVYDPRPILRLLRSTQFDVIDVHEEPASLAALELRILARVTGHRRTPMLFYGAQNIEKRYPIPFRWFERGSLRRASAIHTCNATAGEIFERKGFRGQTRVIPLGIDAGSIVGTDRRPPAGAECVQVGYVGRLEEHKGVQVAIRAVASLPDNFHLDIVGDGPHHRELVDLSIRAGVADRVSFVGFVDHTETSARMRKFDVLVVPSQTRPNWVEQFGRVVVEAMAAGTPVIASSSGSLPEVLGGAGIVVDEDDVNRWAAAISRLTDDPLLWIECNRAGVERARHFDWTVVAATHLDLYREVLG